jgi:carboxyl-terminal processing protease
MLQIVMHNKRFFMLTLAVAALVGVWAGCKSASSADPAPISVAPSPTALKAGPNDPRIAYVAARLLESYHYLQRPLDRDLSIKFFDGYIDELDPRHENFLQSDLDEFAAVRTNLDVLTVGGHATAELAPAFAIYDRFVERSEQHYDYVNELLKQDKFKFNTDERIMVDRRREPFPKDLDEAKALWRQRLRYEFLAEKLAREISETNGEFTVKLPAEAVTNIPATLERHYRWQQRMLTNWDSDAVLQAYLNGLAHAYDPHSDYFGAPKAQDFSIDMNLALFGIGAQLTEDDGYCTIRELVPGGPAIKSKLIKPEDRIVAVAQGNQPPVDAVDMELEKVVQMIRGPKGTEVRLTISPAEDRTARKIVSMVRDEIKLEDKEARAELMVFPNGKRLGLIDLPSFYAPVNLDNDGQSTPKYTSADVTKLVKKLKREKAEGIILDLRSNPGGSLEEAVRFTGLFIKDGPVVLSRDSSGKVMVDSVPDPGQLYDGPLVVMINHFSASASEIAAAALQDYGRALIVGDVSTHGKGTVQELKPLRPYVWPATPTATNDPGTLKITKGKFYRVSGASTQLKGVASDIVLPDILDYSPYVGEKALDNPLPWDTIQPVAYEQFNLVQPYLEELRRRSTARLATNQDYAYIREDIDQYLKLQPDRSTSLNEHEAVAERERITLENEARNKERDGRPLADVKIYDLTVENAGDPGLPAAKSFYVTNNVVLNFKNFTGQRTDQNWTFSVYTNSPDYSESAFTDYLQTNQIDQAAAQIKYTNLPAGYVPDAASTSSQTGKPGVTKSYEPDPALEETERILQDYISLLPKGATLSVAH